jgi:hypothetical protein
MDNRDKSEFIAFVEFAVHHGWFAAKRRATLQPARVAAYTEKSRVVERIGIPTDEFEALKKRVIPLLPTGKRGLFVYLLFRSSSLLRKLLPRYRLLPT